MDQQDLVDQHKVGYYGPTRFTVDQHKVIHRIHMDQQLTVDGDKVTSQDTHGSTVYSRRRQGNATGYTWINSVQSTETR